MDINETNVVDSPVTSLQEIAKTDYPELQPIAEGLLYPGLTLLAGQPKAGKSLLVLMMINYINCGIPIWGHGVTRGGRILYLALEDTEQRLKDRAIKMFGNSSAIGAGIDIMTSAPRSPALYEMLQSYLNQHSDTVMIVVDTFQMIREKTSTYTHDYREIAALKSIADNNGICILLVHHLNKSIIERNPFLAISGSTGLYGAADGAILLHNRNHAERNASIFLSGRDLAAQEIHVALNPENLHWELDNSMSEAEQRSHNFYAQIASMVTPNVPTWEGTASTLVGALGLDIGANQLSRKLEAAKEVLLAEYHVAFQRTRSAAGRKLRLSYVASDADENNESTEAGYQFSLFDGA